MTVLIISILTYVISFIVNYKWIQTAYYHPNGRWNNISPELYDVIMVVTPFINLLFLIFITFDSPYRLKSKKNISINFFKPKNK